MSSSGSSINNPAYKLGKLPPKHHPKTILGSSILSPVTSILNPPPPKVWREYKVQADIWNMFGNDQYGDCVLAAEAHIQMLTSAHTGVMTMPTLDDVLSTYSRITGFSIGPPAVNDNGTVITDAMVDWMNNGLGLGANGGKILGWVKIDHTSIMAVKQAVALFGCLSIGVEFPNSAMAQFNSNLAWSLDMPADGIDGGHCIPVFGYGSVGCNCITWGRRQGMTWPWFLKYCDEAYAVITEYWLSKVTQQTPDGLNLEALQSFLAALKQ